MIAFQKRTYFNPNWFFSLEINNKIRSKTFTHESARIILVLDTFSMVNFVLPPFPAIRPMALERCSPFNGFTVG